MRLEALGSTDTLVATVHMQAGEHICLMGCTHLHSVPQLLSIELLLQGISCFQAKIGFSNAASLRLFGRLGYVEVSRSQMFKEATLRLEVSGTVREALQQQAEKLQLSIYDIS